LEAQLVRNMEIIRSKWTEQDCILWAQNFIKKKVEQLNKEKRSTYALTWAVEIHHRYNIPHFNRDLRALVRETKKPTAKEAVDSFRLAGKHFVDGLRNVFKLLFR